MQVYYMSGAGNDFMVIDARDQVLNFEALTLKLCPITHADGFMALDHSETADFRLHFYNSDGTRGEMCGNGARCICHFAYTLGVAGTHMRIQTDAGIVEGWHLGEGQYRVKLNDPGILDLDRTKEAAYVELGCPGVPHGITHQSGLTFDQKEQLREKAKHLRYHPAFPKGANISFYDWMDSTTVRVLTYERGVEDYTLACGTGCGSLAATLWTRGELPGGELTCQNQGGILKVSVAGEKGNVTSLLLEGPAEIVKIYEV